MNGDLITAAVLFGPAAAFGTTAGIAWWRHRGEHDAVLAELARVQGQQTGPPETPPDGGMPEPATGHLAEVIPLTGRRAA